jgi:hypothetical protein
MRFLTAGLAWKSTAFSADIPTTEQRISYQQRKNFQASPGTEFGANC